MARCVERVFLGTNVAFEVGVYADVTDYKYVDIYVDGYAKSVALSDFERAFETHEDIWNFVMKDQKDQAAIIQDILMNMSATGGWRDIIIDMARAKSNGENTDAKNTMSLYDLLFPHGEVEH